MALFFIQYGLWTAFGCFALGATLSVILGAYKAEKESWIVSHALATAGAVAALSFSVSALFFGEKLSYYSSFPIGIMQNLITLRVDILAAFFIAVISVVAIAASIFGSGYFKQYLGTYRLGHFGFFYNLFIASMVLVVIANNAFLFLLAWEGMAIASYFLVIFERKVEENVGAGMLYILISQLGVAFLFGAFLVLYRFSGSWDFDVIRVSTGSMPLLFQNIALALALIGLASKAGVIPLHIWLPEAHPAAPSHVSALMSGVMIKTAIFMMIRFFIDFFPTAHFSWGLILLGLGAVSSILGVLHALTEHDIKRLLAFHSVENIGIILLGLGASITFFSFGLTLFGAAALVAALYHTVNHALFKALLFLSAGSVVHATGTRNMEEYGGLIKLMPYTSAMFLVGAVAISGLPPFNGFVSEWLTFQSLFAGIAILPIVAKIVFLVGGASLAFTGGLAAACFVKAFGATFLARSRGHVSAHAHEASALAMTGMGMLALLCVLFGIGSGTIAPILMRIGSSFSSHAALTALPDPLQGLGSTAFSMPAIIIALITGLLATGAIVWMWAGRPTIRISRTWDCGVTLTPRMEITATGFSRSIILIFRGLLKPTSQTSIEYDDAQSHYFTKTKTVNLGLPDLYRDRIYVPIFALIERGAARARRIQTGNLNTYLLYIFITLIVLLVWTFR